MIKTIIFDYAGVITPTTNNYYFAFKNHERFGLTTQELMDKTYRDWDKAVVGKLPDKIFWKNLSEDLNIDPEELKGLIIETFPIDKQVIEFIDKIKDHYTIVMVSNQVEGWLEKVIKDNNLKSSFHFFINSYHFGARKPDKKIFLDALEKTDSKPEEVLFVDDKSDNIASAKALGLHAIQFDTFENFLIEVKKYTNPSTHKFWKNPNARLPRHKD